MLRPLIPVPQAARPLLGLTALLAAGCGGPQSALEPAGRDAERIAELFWWMCAASGAIWLATVGLSMHAIRSRGESYSQREATLLIVGGGAVAPAVLLAVLLAYALSTLPAVLAPAPSGGLTIAVTGEQWWWRVRYPVAGGGSVELANEIRLPVGERVAFELASADVIHSFWVPALGGKIDMIPGRQTRLALQPTRTGVFRGVCAEYCGTAHALMRFSVVVLERADFDRWLALEAEPARTPAGLLEKRGLDLFVSNGCGACHAIRGTHADGTIGPDLTHVGSRLTLGAGTLPNGSRPLLRWIARTDDTKPGVHMPSFDMLALDELRAVAAYLDALR